jgi:DNA-binding CsgD family transcriptional regulator
MYDAELKETALALIADGKPAVEVARELDIHPSTLANWKAAVAKAAKLKRKPHGSAEKFAKLRERTAELRAKGKTQIQIAQKLGVSKSSVARWCLEAEAEAKTAAAAKPKPKLTAAKPKPAAVPTPAPTPAPVPVPVTVTGNGLYTTAVQLQTALQAVTIERDALRRALDQIVGCGPKLA